MKTKLCYSLLLGGAVMLTGCGKKLNQFQAEYFSVEPNPLEVVGENVPAAVTGRVPAEFFLKNAEVTVTPYLGYNGTEVASEAFTFQGEKVRGNNQVVSYEYGGTLTIPVMYKYVPEMANSELFLAFDVKQGGKQYVLPRVKVATGVIATATLASAGKVAPAIANDKFQRIINEKYSADIKFLVNQANIRDSELRSAAMNELNEEILRTKGDSTRVIDELNIKSYASPEGGIDINTRLAENREKNTAKYLESKLKKDKVTEFSEITAEFTAEDWEGFQKLVAASDIQDKDLILSVLSMYKDPEQREKEIRNLSSVFEQLAEEILPQLRYSRITASINVIGKSDEEIKNLYKSNPNALSVDELLYCATLFESNADKMQVYNTAVEIYPKDYRSYNNLGVCQFVDEDYDAAKACFQEAVNMAPDAVEPQMNLGLVALVNKNYAEANQRFGAAAGAENLDEAMGVYYLMKGDNNAAVRAFGDSKNNNAALAQILTKDYSKAKATLSAINNPDATTYYLMAVLGARTNNERMVTTNLRQAIKLDSSLAEKARKDLEFANCNLSILL